MEKKMKVNLEELVNAGGHWLELFDRQFTISNRPLHSRPVSSAMLFVKYGVEQLPPGESKDDYLDKEWFAALVVAIREWYRNRYGAAAIDSPSEILGGLVLLYETPIKIEIRTTISKIETENETSWIIFPDKIHESENLASFFPTRPNLDGLPPSEKIELEQQVASTVRNSRSIKLALEAADDLSDEALQMAAGIWGHIEKAVVDILTLKPAVASVGCWDLHLVVEKAFKVFLQQNGRILKGHNLNSLSDAAAQFGLNVTPSLLSKMPNEHRAVNLRYGEAVVEIYEAVAIYQTVLQLTAEITEKLRSTYRLNNAGFLLKKPLWVGRKD